MEEKKGFTVKRADADQLGVRKTEEGYVFSAALPFGQEAELLLYDPKKEEPIQCIPLPAEERVGDVSAVFVAADARCEYAYRVGGKMTADPFAPAVHCVESKKDGKVSIRCALPKPLHMETVSLQIPYEKCLFYKAHVRGFTRQKGSGVRHPGTFLGLTEKIPYLKSLGVTSLMLMPVYTFYEEEKEVCYQLTENLLVKRAGKEETRKNYWGYTGGFYFAPKASYSSAADPEEEFAGMVDALHLSGIECILEFYFVPGTDVRFAGDVLRYWMRRFHVDGFHVVGGGEELSLLAADPFLKHTKLIFSSEEAGERETCQIYLSDTGSSSVKKRYRRIAESGPAYEHVMRAFLKGDDISPEEVRGYLCRNSKEKAYLNYMADQDGFTMADMVSYNEKHNEHNGEGNTDGTNWNCSWNCGEEGPTKRACIRTLRARQLRNAFLILMTSQGIPMIYAGDEQENSQLGNNNAWCQDNEIGWIDWNRGKSAKNLMEFVCAAASFRQAHPVFCRRDPLRMDSASGRKFPDLSYHGRTAWVPDDGRVMNGFGVLYSMPLKKGLKQESEQDDILYVIYNMYWQPQRFALPDLPAGLIWAVKADTADRAGFYPDGEEKLPEIFSDKTISVKERSIIILVPVKENVSALQDDEEKTAETADLQTAKQKTVAQRS